MNGKAMTVQDLIEALMRMPRDAPVLTASLSEETGERWLYSPTVSVTIVTPAGTANATAFRRSDGKPPSKQAVLIG